MIDETPVALKTSTPKQTFQDLHARGQHYLLLKTALRELAVESVEADIVLWAIRAYSALGLTGPACELLDELEKGLGRSADIDALRQQLAMAPSGQVSWSSYHQRFEKNAASLYEKCPQLREHDAAFRTVPRMLDLFRANDKNLHVSTQDKGLGRIWISGLYDRHHLIAQTKLPHDPTQLFCAPYVILGDRLGDLFRLTFDGTKKMFMGFQPRIYFVEPDPLLFGMMLYLTDICQALCDERTSVVIGASSVDEISELLTRHPARTVPEHMMMLSAPESLKQQLLDRLEALDLAHKKEVVSVIGANRDYYDSLGSDHWPDRFGDVERPLRVLGLTSRFTTVLQHSMRDLKSAFERLGHHFDLSIEENNHDLVLPRHIAREIESLRPDLIFLIDHLRHEHLDVIPPNVPSICWIQDRMAHLFTKEAGQQVKPLEFIMGYGFSECLTRFDYPADRFFPCLIPTDTKKFLDPNEGPKDLEPFRCDVMYASNSMRFPAERFEEQRRIVDKADRPLVDVAYDLLMEIVRHPSFCGDYDYEALVGRAEEESGTRASKAEVRTTIASMLRDIADLHLRLKMVRAVARWANETGGKFHLYGLGWADRDEFSRYAQGVVRHGVPLGRAFRAAKISLHGGCNPGLHQRVLDGLAAKGFFLIGEKPSDTSHAANQAIHRFIKNHGSSAPVRLMPNDLPEPHASFFADFLRIRGTDPTEGIELTQEMILNVQAECEQGTRHTISSLWPEYDKIVFNGDEALIERVEYFVRHEDERNRLASQMRDAVLENFTYDALVRAAIDFIRDHLKKN
ncbi:MAG: glycosyltransferase [Phycisphaerales bacterium]|nr:glycosyltransferase [Phycisphaerales bacterium]